MLLPTYKRLTVHYLVFHWSRAVDGELQLRLLRLPCLPRLFLLLQTRDRKRADSHGPETRPFFPSRKLANSYSQLAWFLLSSAPDFTTTSWLQTTNATRTSLDPTYSFEPVAWHIARWKSVRMRVKNCPPTWDLLRAYTPEYIQPKYSTLP